jgi:hypothetical protein
MMRALTQERIDKAEGDFHTASQEAGVKKIGRALWPRRH